MRILRLVLVTIVCLIAGIAGGAWAYNWISVRRSLAKQADEIAAHRAAQRAAAPPAAVVTSPSGGTTTPAATAEGGALEPAAPPYWTAFRGPQRDGRYLQRPIVTSWPSTGLRPLWKQPVGSGFASFAAANGRAFTIEQRGTQEVVAAYDVMTGRELWTHGWNRTFGGNKAGPRATPAWHDGVVYALGATGELRALADADGRQIWRADILEDAGAGNLDWGVAASPLVVDDTVVVLPGGGNGKSLAAYDRRTGNSGGRRSTMRRRTRLRC